MRHLLGVLLVAAACHHAPHPSAPPSGVPEAPAPTPAAVQTALPAEPPPAGFEWRDRVGDLGLAGRPEDSDQERTCEVWNLKLHQRIAVTTGNDVSAGGADPDCYHLSPRATLVQWGNGRNTVWKNLQDQTTACRGVVAPDDASCVEDDVSPMLFAGHDGKGDDLELSWSKPIVDGPAKVVFTIPDGLDRNYGDEVWWTVRYCSADRAEIDLRGGTRVVIAAATGDAKVTKVAADAKPCE